MTVNRTGRVFDARPDTVDFRDLIYVPTLVQVPPERQLARFCRYEVPVLDQGRDGACTGYALATVANYLLCSRDEAPDRTPVSPEMLYDLARRYDEWPGEDYDGSSARGAMKGWHRHGVCAQELWRHVRDGDIPRDVARDALRRPLGAYFRVNHKDLVAIHSAISEVGVPPRSTAGTTAKTSASSATSAPPPRTRRDRMRRTVRGPTFQPASARLRGAQLSVAPAARAQG